jgi:rhodanese-related sulfurtransferase
MNTWLSRPADQSWNLGPRALRNRLIKSAVLIDVREPEELRAGPSVNAIPMDRVYAGPGHRPVADRAGNPDRLLL